MNSQAAEPVRELPAEGAPEAAPDAWEEGKALRRQIIRLAVPTSLEMVLHQAFGLVDQLFVASLGEPSLVAAGLAAQILAVAFVVLMSLGLGASILLTRHAGARDASAFSLMAANLLTVAALASVGVAAALVASAEPLLRVIGAEPAVTERGVLFLQLVGWSLPFMLLMEVGSQVLRARGDARSPMFIVLLSLLLNSGLNYLLIFGALGLPALGLAGAGLATLLARGVGFVLMFQWLLSPRFPLRVQARDLLRLGRERIWSIISLALPVAAGHGAWMLGMLFYTVVYARVGSSALAAANVLSQIEGLWLTFSYGFSTACLTLMGQAIGSRRPDGALAVARETLRLVLGMAVVTGLVVGGSSLLLGRLYPQLTAQTLELASLGLLAMALVQPVKLFNMMLATGVLRAGGDVRFVMACETLIVPGIVCSYGMGVGLGWGFAGALVGKVIEELSKLTAFTWRYLSRRWMHDLKSS